MNSYRQKILKESFPYLYRNLLSKPRYNAVQRILRWYFCKNQERRVQYSELMRKFSFLPSIHAYMHSIQLFGMECQDGWFNIIYDLSEELEDLICKLPRRERKHYYVDQLKEKYGSLRFYMSASTKEMDVLISKAEDLSEKTCEVCGEPGILYTGGWWHVACHIHKK